MQRLSISTEFNESNFFYSRTSLNFTPDYPIKRIIFGEQAVNKEAIIEIYAWCVLDLIKLQSHFLTAEDMWHRSIAERHIEIILTKNMSRECIHTTIELLLEKVSKLQTHCGATFEFDPCIATMKSVIRKCVNRYMIHLREGFPNQHIVKTLSKKSSPVSLDPNQQELVQLLDSGADILVSLRKGVNLKITDDETFFLSHALPLNTWSEEKRFLSNILNNICLLVEYGLPIFCEDKKYHHTILALILDTAFSEELRYQVKYDYTKRVLKKFLSTKTVLEGLILPVNEDGLFHHPSGDGFFTPSYAQLEEESERIEIDKDKATFDIMLRSLHEYCQMIRFYKNLIRLFMFLDNEQTVFYPVSSILAGKSEIANWIAIGQKALKLDKQIPSQLSLAINALPGESINYKLMPGLVVSVPAIWRINTSDNKHLIIKTMLLSNAIKFPGIMTRVFEIYLHFFIKGNNHEFISDYFKKILDSNYDTAYLDVVILNDHISAFHIGKFVCTQKNEKSVLLYHGVLAAAQKEVTNYPGLMTWLIYWRGFLPTQYHIELETLAVVEAASLASYLQLIKLGIPFNPQFNILEDWIPVLHQAIYSKEKLYRDEVKIVEAGNVYRISDPLAQFKPQEENLWKIKRTTLTSHRLALNPAQYDHICFFKCNKESYQKFQQQILPKQKL